MKMIYSIFPFLLFLLANNVIAKVVIVEDLKASLEMLYDSNPRLKFERENLKSKDELYPQALSEFRPVISGYYEKGKVDTNSTGFNITSDGIRTESNKGITFSQRIFDGGSSLSNIQVAKNEILAQRSQLKDIEQEVFIEAIILYADLATENSNFRLKEKNEEVLSRQLELTKEQFQIGEVTLTDVSIAEARLSLAESELLESSNKLNSISAKFFAIFGLKPNNPNIEIAFNDLNLEIENLKSLSEENNPKIKNLIFKIKSSENNIKSLRRKQLPSVKLEAEAKINEGYFRTDSKREVLSAFAKIDIPFYQSGLASSKIREQKKLMFALKQLLQQTKNEIQYNIISAFSSFEFSKSRIDAYQKQIKSNKIYLEGLRQELELGERTTLDLLDGEQELFQSELDLVRAKKDFFLSYYEILFFTGMLNARDLGLSVNYFDETENYDKVKRKWLDILE